MVRHRLAAFTGMAALCLATVGIGALAAQAAPATAATTKCTLSGSATISPGLTSKPQHETDTLNSGTTLSSCTGNAGVTSGTESGTFTSSKQTCTTGTAKGTLTTTWNNGKTSIGTVTFKNTATTGVLKVSGKITGGTQSNMKGGTVSGFVKFTPTQGNCVTSPITKVSIASSNSSGGAAPIKL